MTSDPLPDAPVSREEVPIGKPFGEENRKKLISEFLAAHGSELTSGTAWKAVYRMLLWPDRTTGLAHCYESDKSQPGRAWYARSLSFHLWLSRQLGTTPRELGALLDWLFRAAIKDSLRQVGGQHARYKAVAERQRSAFLNEEFPLPGLDPEIKNVLLEVLAPFFSAVPGDEAFEAASDRLREYWKQENKRKNLLGEGFEDVLAALVRLVVGGSIRARTRTRVADVTGFYSPGAKDKATKVDLVLEHPEWPRPALINVKWSIRADREDQLWDDFNEYVRFDRDHRGFDHYLVTNEFDPARVNAVCDRREANNHVFKNVVHITTEGLLSAYGDVPQTSLFPDEPSPKAASDSAQRVRQQVRSERLIGFSKWLKLLGAT